MLMGMRTKIHEDQLQKKDQHRFESEKGMFATVFSYLARAPSSDGRNIPLVAAWLASILLSSRLGLVPV